MPTGYTAKIAEEGFTFEDYAMGCARAFGACVTMRDDSSDAEIPVFKPSEYNLKALKKANEKIAELKATTLEDAQTLADAEWEQDEVRRKEQLLKNQNLRKKYEAMLAEAKAWVPPTTEHEGMKKFMIEQIVDSIKFDCSEEFYSDVTPKKSGQEWKDEGIANQLKDIAYHTKSNADEIERTDNRNQWIVDLKNSL